MKIDDFLLDLPLFFEMNIFDHKFVYNFDFFALGSRDRPRW